MEKQISIIIPTYNMEAYIGKCLDSLLIPEFDQVEVWVVNDGSKDRSSEIAHTYADRYPGSIHVLDKPNGNYGSCINAALPLCTGRYVKVLDADDTFDTEAFSEYVKKLSSITQDLIVTPYISKEENDNNVSIWSPSVLGLEEDKIYDFESITNLFESRIAMHCLTYKRDVFSLFVYRQTENISYTDVEWSILPCCFCKSIIFVNKPVYHYLIGRSGQTMDSNNLRRSVGDFFAILENLIKSKEKLNIKSDYFFKCLVGFHSEVYYRVLSYRDNNAMQLLKSYDLWLNKTDPEVFDALNQIKYDAKVNFCTFFQLRKCNYEIHFKIPFWVKVTLSIKNKLLNLCQ